MRIHEILLPRDTKDNSISQADIKKVDFLQKKIDYYIDKISDPSTSKVSKGFLKLKLKDKCDELRDILGSVNIVTEAIYKLPLSHKDFEILKELLNRPIPAIIAHIYILDVINDDELNDQISSIEVTQPNRDIRPLIVDWVKRVMPDQMYHFDDNLPNLAQKNGALSPIHGYDSGMYKGTNDPITGNAYGSY
jgi:hypothetical protein